MLAEDLTIPFDWLLEPFEIMMMKKDEIEQWVESIAVYRPNLIRTEADRQTIRENGIERLRWFLNACKKLE